MPADDPYRTLGLERSATLDEVKRAYRRLVKVNHPDAAGEAALQRFLAIQDAYDRIVGPDPGDRRGRDGPGDRDRRGGGLVPERELRPSDGDGVPVAEVLLVDVQAVDARAVGGLEVDEPPDAPRPLDLGVLLADPGVAEDEPVRGGGADPHGVAS